MHRGESVIGRNENTLFREAVDNDKNGVVARGGRKVFDEVHGDGVPWKFRDQELFEETIRLVATRFSSSTDNARFTIVNDECTHFGPSVVAADELKSLVAAQVARKGVIMFVAEDTEPEVVLIGDVDTVV